ncbi:MAG: hypothetical protein JW864_08350, partial [Spirochaetes bacterium]|nr:hypothetical protein [Spirochaetota bacterium]
MGRTDRETRFIKPEGTSVGSGSFETEFEYDLLNRKRTILYPTDPKTGTRISVRYKYASTGVTEVSVYNSTGRKEILSGVLYNEFGQMTEVARGNGTSTHYEYDIKERLANLVTFTQTNAQTRKLQDVSYTFKIDGSIASTVNTPDLDTGGGYHSMVRYDYAYDGLNRLIKAQGNYARSSMAYDPGSSPALDSEKQFERGYVYAANGNMVQYTPSASGHSPLAGGATSTPKIMEYDSSNRLVRVTNPDAGNELIGRYWYDDQGFRVRKIGRREVSGQTRDIEVIYPSMYFGIEKHRT